MDVPVADTNDDQTLIFDSNYQWALDRYNKSISRINLSPHSDTETLGTAIITCLLFICIEFLQSNVQRSRILFRVSRTLIDEFRRTGNYYHSPELYTMLHETVLPIFARLDTLMMFTFHQFPNQPITRTKMLPRRMPECYSDPPQASAAFFELIDSHKPFMAESHIYAQFENRHLPVPTDLVSRQKDILRELDDWHIALLNTLHAVKSPSYDPYTLSLLLIHYNIALTWIWNALQPFECGYDSATPIFENIISHARTAINTNPHKPVLTGKPQRPTFMFDTDLAFSLYYTATHCRHPHIRREAISLMKQTANKEGLWNSIAMSRVAEKVVEIEEEGIETGILPESPSSPESTSPVRFPAQERRIRKIKVDREQHYDGESIIHRWYISYTRYHKDENDEWTTSREICLLEQKEQSLEQRASTEMLKHYSDE